MFRYLYPSAQVRVVDELKKEGGREQAGLELASLDRFWLLVPLGVLAYGPASRTDPGQPRGGESGGLPMYPERDLVEVGDTLPRKSGVEVRDPPLLDLRTTTEGDPLSTRLPQPPDDLRNSDSYKRANDCPRQGMGHIR